LGMGSSKGKHSSAMDPPWILHSLADPYGHSTGRSRVSYSNSYCNLANYHPFKKRRGIGYNSGMKRITAIALSGLLMLSLSSCGYQGFYRYPCQDPANWEKAECNPPICEATGTCTKDVIGKEPTTTTETGTSNG
jgi:hypothetical protein